MYNYSLSLVRQYSGSTVRIFSKYTNSCAGSRCTALWTLCVAWDTLQVSYPHYTVPCSGDENGTIVSRNMFPNQLGITVPIECVWVCLHKLIKSSNLIGRVITKYVRNFDWPLRVGEYFAWILELVSSYNIFHTQIKYVALISTINFELQTNKIIEFNICNVIL